MNYSNNENQQETFGESFEYKLKVVRASTIGRDIQKRSKRNSNSCWTYDPFPIFDFENFDYRIKPDPKTVWFALIRKPDGALLVENVFKSWHQYKRYIKDLPVGYQVIKECESEFEDENV